MYALIHGSGTGGAVLGANTYHQTLVTAFNTAYFASGTGQSHTYDDDRYDAWLAGIATFKDAMRLRITEISNRIGYLNGKGGQASGVADGGTGTQPTSGTNPTNTVTTAGFGFLGTAFNGGSGYANTIYAHCNFLAGKKIKLLEKIMKAIEDVDEIYKQIEGKRAEYYEYNASGE